MPRKKTDENIQINRLITAAILLVNVFGLITLVDWLKYNKITSIYGFYILILLILVDFLYVKTIYKFTDEKKLD